MKEYNVNKVADALRAQFDAADWNEITVTMKCNGDAVTLTPCTSKPGNVTCEEDVGYILVNSPSISWLGGINIEEVAGQLANYEQSLIKNDDDMVRLGEMRDELVKGEGMTSRRWDELYDFYSDWSKDVLGYRDRIAKPAHLA